MDKSKIKKSAVEAVMIVVGGALAFMVKPLMPSQITSGMVEALVGVVIVFVGAYIDHEFVGPLIIGFGVGFAVDGLSASLPTL